MIARGDGAAERQHGRPGEPVAPYRQRRDELRIAQPGSGAIDRRAARLIAEHAGDLGIGEGLHEAHDHGDDPDQEGEFSGRAGNAADREQDQRRHAAATQNAPRQSIARLSCWPLPVTAIASLVMRCFLSPPCPKGNPPRSSYPVRERSRDCRRYAPVAYFFLAFSPVFRGLSPVFSRRPWRLAS